MHTNSYRTRTEESGSAWFESANGARHRAVEFTEWVEATHLESTQTEWIPRSKFYQLDNGQLIKEQLDGQFVNESTGIEFTKIF